MMRKRVIRVNAQAKHAHVRLRRTCLLLPLLIAVGFVAEVQGGSVQLVQHGTWGLSMRPDPFRKRYPVVVYVPPGTIVFKTRLRPSQLRDYVGIQTQYGYWVQVPESLLVGGKMAPVLRSIEGLAEPPPSDHLILHSSILCLGQTNRIATPPDRCKPVGDGSHASLQVGKGWVYSFSPSEDKPDWLDLRTSLDGATRSQLRQRGLDPAWANFEVRQTDLVDLEKRGYLTLLNKTHPLVEFEFANGSLVYVECGQEQVTLSRIEAAATLEAKAELGLEAPLWSRVLVGLKGKLGLASGGFLKGTKEKVWKITVDTKKASYLYYAVQMRDAKSGKKSTILVEKVFECTAPPTIAPGDKILNVTFEIETPGAPDLTEYKLVNSSKYLSVPSAVFQHHPRPVFISVNSPEQHARALASIVNAWDVEVSLGHFMLANINYSCASERRPRCADLIENARNEAVQR